MLELVNKHFVKMILQFVSKYKQNNPANTQFISV